MDKGFFIDKTKSANWNYMRMIYTNMFPNDNPTGNDPKFDYEAPKYNRPSLVIKGAGVDFDPVSGMRTYLILSNRFVNTDTTRKVYFGGAGLDYWLDGTEVVQITATDTEETIKAKVDALTFVPPAEYGIGGHGDYVQGKEGVINLFAIFPTNEPQLYLLPGKIKFKMI